MKTKQEVVDELKKRIKAIVDGPVTTYMSSEQVTAITYGNALRLVKQIDEPEKVKVPECVGKDLDVFTKARLKEDLVKDICLAVYDYSQGTPFDTSTVNWCRKSSNLRTMIDAIWNGYEVEEEPKYRVLFPNTTDPTFKHCYLKKGRDICYSDSLDSIPEFTEQEIKSIDERYWPFAVPVEKV